MKLSKIRELEIAKSPFDISQKCPQSLEYNKWIDFIESNNNLIWKENTEEGKNNIKNINSVPEFFRERLLSSLNKRTACYDFDKKKNQYGILFTFRSEFNYIGISIERNLSISDLKIFLAMAKHLDAFLLINGKEIIDDKMIESII